MAFVIFKHVEKVGRRKPVETSKLVARPSSLEEALADAEEAFPALALKGQVVLYTNALAQKNLEVTASAWQALIAAKEKTPVLHVRLGAVGGAGSSDEGSGKSNNKGKKRARSAARQQTPSSSSEDDDLEYGEQRQPIAKRLRSSGSLPTPALVLPLPTSKSRKPTAPPSIASTPRTTVSPSPPPPAAIVFPPQPAPVAATFATTSTVAPAQQERIKPFITGRVVGPDGKTLLPYYLRRTDSPAQLMRDCAEQYGLSRPHLRFYIDGCRVSDNQGLEEQEICDKDELEMLLGQGICCVGGQRGPCEIDEPEPMAHEAEDQEEDLFSLDGYGSE